MSDLYMNLKIFEVDSRNKNKSKKHNLLQEATIKNEDDFRTIMKKYFG